MKLVTRQEAKARNLKHYFTGEPCPKGHISERIYVSSVCVQCQISRNHEKSAEVKKRRDLEVSGCSDLELKKIITKEEAKAQGKETYFTGRRCKEGHRSERSLSGGNCLTCAEARDQLAKGVTRSKRKEKLLKLQKIHGGKIISMTEAREKGLLTYFTGTVCGRGHIAERYTSGRGCLQCQDDYKSRKNEFRRASYDPEKKRQEQKRFFERNPDKMAEYNTRSYWKTRKRWQEQRQSEEFYIVRRGKDKKYYSGNLEKFRLIARERSRTALGQLRRMHQQAAKRLELGTLKGSRFDLMDYGPVEWLDYIESTLPEGMDYIEAKIQGYHIDHIIPLSFILDAFAGDKILAFQFAEDLRNLQMIPETENQAKTNRLDWDIELQNSTFDYLCEKYL